MAVAAGDKTAAYKSLTFEQAVALIGAARSYGLYAYVLSLLVGVRTEEARALRWDRVDLEENPDAKPPVPPHVDVWRSVRAHADTKTKKSRRSLGLPKMAAEVLREHLQRQADARRSLRTICRRAGLDEQRTPRELRHTFVPLLSDNGMAIGEISPLVGHSSSNVIPPRGR